MNDMFKLKSDEKQDLNLYLWLAVNPQNTTQPILPYHGCVDLNYSLDESMKGMNNTHVWTNIGSIPIMQILEKVEREPTIVMNILDPPPEERKKNVETFINNLELLSDTFAGDSDKKTLKRIIKKIKN